MVLCMRDWVSLGQRGQAGKLAGKLETRELAAQEPLDEPSSRFNVPLAPAKTRHRVGPGPGVNQLNVDPHGISLPSCLLGFVAVVFSWSLIHRKNAKPKAHHNSAGPPTVSLKP